VIARGDEAPIRPGSQVRLARAVTLEFLSSAVAPTPAMGETYTVD